MKEVNKFRKGFFRKITFTAICLSTEISRVASTHNVLIKTETPFLDSNLKTTNIRRRSSIDFFSIIEITDKERLETEQFFTRYVRFMFVAVTITVH